MDAPSTAAVQAVHLVAAHALCAALGAVLALRDDRPELEPEPAPNRQIGMRAWRDARTWWWSAT
ncbi:MAG: hypothetical protein BGO38_10280 [Cellulomonas sp. 73-145]|uniref:hypothetical protein n=1 Tax=Cellulomonas sp. 73-145 TaxID=1895739 RepID=UPI000927DD29|nr:hypothetical protein [Cellulomonas sp. 73-145]OJV60595.1 MAG: hypothetical protein BGO38_10280 [Cellulomonas sp. 73-145]